MNTDDQARSQRENDDTHPASGEVNTGGGVYAGGDVVTGGGDFTGRDKTVHAFRAKTINIYNAPGSPAAQPSAPSSEPAPALPNVPCPYRGLEPFEVEHAPNYFGRAVMVQKLLDKLQTTNFVAVVGPSGSGKSSLVRAGLLTALHDNKLPGSRTWDIALLRPGEDPLRALAQPLVERLSSTFTPVERMAETRKLADHLRDGTLPIGDTLAHLREQPTHPPRLLLLIDQFEETFTLCTDEQVRRTFLSALLTAAETAWVTVLFTLRADFYGRVLEDEHFGQRVDQGLVNVLPMNAEERRTAIEQPSLNAGRRFEEGLVQRILDAVAAAPGELPLLEFALTELWERQTPDGLLTHTAYAVMGELNGAIAQRADNALKSFNVTEQVAVRKVFTRLVRVAQPDEGAEDTKRRINLSELDAAIQPLVRKLADARLLVTSHDDETGEETVEVAHEALIRNWDALKGWLNGDREFLLWRQRLRTMVANWQASGRDAGALVRGTLLMEGRGWLQTRTTDLSAQERDFIAESQAAAEREGQEQEAVRQRELKQARTLATRQRLLLIAVTTILVLVISAGWYIYGQNKQLGVEKQHAVTAQATAEASAQLANQKLAELKGEQLLQAARKQKAAGDPMGAIVNFKAAVAANPTLNVSAEISDTLRDVATKLTEDGEALLRQAINATDAALRKQIILSATAQFSAALALQPPPDTLVYVYIPPGEFLMGASMTETVFDTDERPQPKVVLDGFWIMRTEVTNAQYKRCVEATVCTKPINRRWDKTQFAKQPVTDVSLNHANQYAAWVGGRLPTEAEWEYACRGPEHRIYPWGNDAPTPARLNYGESAFLTSIDVGSYLPGANGLFDMAGNVSEWTADRHDEVYYTLRGGSFSDEQDVVGCGARFSYYPSGRDYVDGFRVVTSPSTSGR